MTTLLWCLVPLVGLVLLLGLMEYLGRRAEAKWDTAVPYTRTEVLSAPWTYRLSRNGYGALFLVIEGADVYRLRSYLRQYHLTLEGSTDKPCVWIRTVEHAETVRAALPNSKQDPKKLPLNLFSGTLGTLVLRAFTADIPDL